MAVKVYYQAGAAVHQADYPDGDSIFVQNGFLQVKDQQTRILAIFPPDRWIRVEESYKD